MPQDGHRCRCATVAVAVSGADADFAFETLWRVHRAGVIRVAARAVHHPSLLDEVVADVFIVAWRRVDQLVDPPCSSGAAAWLRGITGLCVLKVNRTWLRHVRLLNRVEAALAFAFVPPPPPPIPQ